MNKIYSFIKEAKMKKIIGLWDFLINPKYEFVFNIRVIEKPREVLIEI